jgi:beta-mannosidase
VARGKLFRVLILCAITLMIVSAASFSQNRAARIRKQLPQDWSLRQAGTDAWNPAIVPGCVHSDLLNNGIIHHPFYRDNEQSLQWIGKTDWECECTFEVEPKVLEYGHIELVFDGLDTYAEVRLNGELVLSADNMFRQWRIPVEKILKAGENKLQITFESPIEKIVPIMKNLPYELPAGNDQGEKTSPFTRKAPYQYGWDWGPRFVTCGVWRPVYVEAWNHVRIESVYYLQNGISADKASISAEIEILSDSAATAEVVISDSDSSFAQVTATVNLIEGLNLVSIPFEIADPILWWPRGYGDQHLYTFQTELLLKDEVVDQTETRVGLRSLELRREVDGWGNSFEFVVNGVPVFAKGGNWIPADSFPSAVTPERYRWLVGSCAAANMNMLRVWGGGIYEDDLFYDYCDELGILVWQDFMFACSLYPGDPAFLESVRAEAVDNVKRLRNHPSIVLWCGNNEVETGWFNWGWNKQYPASVWRDYYNLFHHVLPEVCALYDPARPYWPSSPSSNLEDDPNSQVTGDNHYWDVWHGAKPFEDYETLFPRFCSEYGFQSFPLLESVAEFTLPEDQDIESPVMTAHQKHPRGNQLIREYMLREYPQPKDFESFLYVSQVLQAEGIKIGAEHLRRLRPRCMGSLYWQINDCWPVASWSSIDFYGRWKALQFYARRFYNDILISPNEEDGYINVYVVSDRTESVTAEILVRLMDFSGTAVKEVRATQEISPLSSTVAFSLNRDEFIAGADTKEVFLNCVLSVDGRQVSDNRLFFHPIKELALPTPDIKVYLWETPGGYSLFLTTARFAKAVYLRSDDPEITFGDNFFDLPPGTPKEVTVYTDYRISARELMQKIKVKSLMEAF